MFGFIRRIFYQVAFYINRSLENILLNRQRKGPAGFTVFGPAENREKQVSSRVGERDPPVFRFGADPKIQSPTNNCQASNTTDWK
ncbi:MAG: hypothetical protein C0433_05505 [Cyclobacterium sp.]|nr:hypothetical protein [Cyclobacterium sp.]